MLLCVCVCVYATRACYLAVTLICAYVHVVHICTCSQTLYIVYPTIHLLVMCCRCIGSHLGLHGDPRPLRDDCSMVVLFIVGGVTWQEIKAIHDTVSDHGSAAANSLALAPSSSSSTVIVASTGIATSESIIRKVFRA